MHETMITSKDNEKLKLIRRLAERKHREREGLFVAEGEDLVEAAEAAGVEPEFVLRAGVEVEPRLLDAVSALGSGTRVIGVYRQAWGERRGAAGQPARGGGPRERRGDHPHDARAARRPGRDRPRLRRPVRARRRCARAWARSSACRRPGGIARSSRRSSVSSRTAARRPTTSRSARCASAASARACRPSVAAACDRLWTIPLRGGVESLNVAAAAAVAIGRISSAAGSR